MTELSFSHVLYNGIIFKFNDWSIIGEGMEYCIKMSQFVEYYRRNTCSIDGNWKLVPEQQIFFLSRANKFLQ
jgi:hypothetical protein